MSQLSVTESRMKCATALLGLLLLMSTASQADEAPPTNATKTMLTNHLEDFCFIAGMPPSDVTYRVVKKIKLAKGTYGSVRDILPALAERARQAGADAIIGYAGSQRFGFFPWRMVRPVARGTAVQWTNHSNETRDCAAMGGSRLETILESNSEPGSGS